MPKSAQRQFLTSVSGIAGLWATFAGGAAKSSATKVYDGGATEPDVLTSPPDYDDVTVTRPYDAQRDEPLLARLIPQCGKTTHTITRQPTDQNLVRVGQARSYHGLLTGVSGPDADAGSSEAAMVSLTFAIQRVT